jgi:hypothetical protein
MIISDNTIICASGATTTAGITVTATPRTIVTDNVIQGSGTTVAGIVIGSSSTLGSVHDNLITGCVTEVNDGATIVIASATSLALPSGKSFFIISGTTAITSIAAAGSSKGRIVTLMFQDVLNFTDGNNLVLASTLATTANDTITIACDGTNWYEVSRSVNP